MKEDLVPKWTKVTIYSNSTWSKFADTATPVPVDNKGYVLSFGVSCSNKDIKTVRILKENGQFTEERIGRVKFHIGEMLDPYQKSLIPEGVRVICYNTNTLSVGRQELHRANFLRFSNGRNPDGGSVCYAVVLRDDGVIDSFPADWIQICGEEEKEENPILKRLRSINE